MELRIYDSLTEEEKTKAYTTWCWDNRKRFQVEACANLNTEEMKTFITELVKKEVGIDITIVKFEIVNENIIPKVRNNNADGWKVVHREVRNALNNEFDFEKFEIWAMDKYFNEHIQEVNPNETAGDRSEIRTLDDDTPILLKMFCDEFTNRPGAEYRYYGDNSGQEFQEEHLRYWVRQALKEEKKLVIDFAGVYGLPFTFIRGAFGHLQYDVFAAEGINLKDVIHVINSGINEDEYTKKLQDKVNKFIEIGWDLYQKGATPEEVHLPRYLNSIKK